MWRWVWVGVILIAITIFGFSLADGAASSQVTAAAALAVPPQDISGFARADAPYDWQFPQDFGPHPDFQTEWWYYTGNLFTQSGERFGFQFTIFRRALQPGGDEARSEWRTDQLYMAHFTLSDIGGQQFYHAERYSRGGAGLAGATADPRYRVWLEDWEVLALDDAATQTVIRAATDEVAIDLALTQVKPPALQGDGGLSPKSAEVGNASYYYTLSRLETTGTIQVGDQSYAVTGLSWKDHEFSTSALGQQAQGWDWFGLIFDDGREMMLGQIRLTDGGREPAFGGLLIEADGSTRYLPATAFQITALDTWTSPHTGAVYPSGWAIEADLGDAAPLRFTITPAMRDQELHGSAIAYWEGAVDIAGDVTGVGYAELTGYVSTMQGRF